MNWRRNAWCLLAVCTICVGPLAAEPDAGWRLESVAVVDGFDVPECLVPDPLRDVVYVANIATPDQGYWEDDGKGFISTIAPDGTIKKLRWIDSTLDAPIHAPKGMCILNDHLYVSDNTRLQRISLKTAGPPQSIPLPGAVKLNDMATDGIAAYVSDVGQGVIYRVDAHGGHTMLKAPGGVNGITFHKGRMFAVSWSQHDVYEVDPKGSGVIKTFGVADHFKGLDAVEALDDKTLLVSDFGGNKVCAVNIETKTVRTLHECPTPADVGIDRARGLLYIPQLTVNKVAVFRIKRQ